MVNSPSVPVNCNIVEDVAYEGLDSTAKNAFLEWFEVRNTINIVDDKAVFINKTGKRMQESDVGAIFEALANSSNIKVGRRELEKVLEVLAYKIKQEMKD